MNKFTAKEITIVMESIGFDAEDKTIKITKEMCKSPTSPLNRLIGYKVKLKLTAGYHYNDGQLVDYCFTFTNPKKAKTEVNTQMCLMVGWNHWGEVKIK